jgi:plastocyanin
MMAAFRTRVGNLLLAAAAALGVPACTNAPVEPAPGPSVHDSSPPAELPAEPEGAWGFSHYVFSRVGGRITTTLVEGPRVGQVRCQSEDLPCSYLDLKALDASGAPIPDDLHLTPADLAALVSELDTVSQELARFDSVDRACREGYRREGTQNSNMGIHLMNNDYRVDGVFDLRKPEMLLFGMPGGETLSADELGDCVNGEWTGDRRHTIVGAAFILPTEDFGDDHVKGFTGPLDNWHTHYHTCLGLNATAILARAACEAGGGTYVEKYGWMIHVYAVPAFDNQAGVFAMWNPAIWPLVDAATLRRPGGDIVGRESVIFDFRFQSLEVEKGDTVTFRNADHFFHSVQAGTPAAPLTAFASGDLYADQTFAVRFDEPGVYPFYCRHHPVMIGTVTVR